MGWWGIMGSEKWKMKRDAVTGRCKRQLPKEVRCGGGHGQTTAMTNCVIHI
jgi:hypothetical protein